MFRLNLENIQKKNKNKASKILNFYKYILSKK